MNGCMSEISAQTDNFHFFSHQSSVFSMGKGKDWIEKRVFTHLAHGNVALDAPYFQNHCKEISQSEPFSVFLRS